MLVPILGDMSIGSSGLGRSLIKANKGPQTSPLCQVSLVQDHISIFQGDFAINSIKVKPVPDVPSSTLVSNVMEITGFPTAIFVPPLIDHQLNACPLPPSLPTPIRIDRFLSFLDGYTSSSVRYLKDGFTAGFRLD